jgi:hypothetical protein
VRACALAIAVVLAGGCEDEKDSPEDLQNKAECLRLEEHLFQITPAPGATAPEADPARIKRLVDKVPVEDIALCAAVKNRGIIACMQAAPDVAALRACIPAKTE